MKCVYFVREFQTPFQPERKVFFSRPKLDGLWVRLRFRDEDIMEGLIGNDLLDLLDCGVQITPPDLHGNNLRIYIPRSALLEEVKVLGVVGAARRTPQAPAPSRNPNSSPNEFKVAFFDPPASASRGRDDLYGGASAMTDFASRDVHSQSTKSRGERNETWRK